MSSVDYFKKIVPAIPKAEKTTPPERRGQARRGIIEQTLSQKSSELLYRLWNGSWSVQDEADFRTLVDELKKRGAGAWSSKIYSAISKDGLEFEKEKKLCVDGGSAFEAVAAVDGTIKIISVNFDVESIIARRGVSGRMDLSVSEDGLNFKREMRFRVIDLYIKETIDPDIVSLPDGGLRIYYLCPSSWQGGAGVFASNILSAVSYDGYNFWQEPGVRFENPWQGIDHKVLRIDEKKYKIFNHTFIYGENGAITDSIIQSATSMDGGMTFKPDKNHTGIHGNVVSARSFDEGFRMYYHGRSEEGKPGIVVRSAFSKDGEHWKEEDGLRLSGGGCPTVVKTKDRKYRMYYEVRGTES